ncbi:MAG TPA: hypothetical protein VFB51_00840 [Solirubrobacterales bacterium]|nr:hypothetical protein [Solirubrobacterales bacterium]
MKRTGILLLAATALLIPANSAFAGHGLEKLDHPYPAFSTGAPAPTFLSGRAAAQWELVATFPTGNPHTDIDFFTKSGETYMSAGTLGTGPNGGGQTILKLTNGGVVQPSFVAGHPSAACPSNPVSALGLQHDVEATPKGGALLNTPNNVAVNKEAQLLIDASDANGRCHDGGDFGLTGTAQGGLEIIDITNPALPKEIGLTSHIGESHTVNIDPKRPHIAYSVTSDSVSVDENGVRGNEDPNGGETLSHDGFEVVDLSSCMNFPAGTSLETKRAQCRPEVYRYRYPSANIALGTELRDHIYACHETEIYPGDLLTCASGNASILFNMKNAFDNMGTPHDYSDDKPRGEPLPCKVRPSSSDPQFTTGAPVIDCVNGERNGNPVGLDIPNWIADGAPSLEGVQHVGSVFHQGRGAPGNVPGTTAHPSWQDVDFAHETEFTQSRKYLVTSDERGGGVLPPGASCAQGVDQPEGNGGLHFYRVDRLRQSTPATAQQAYEAYARQPSGKKAIFRAPIRTAAQASFCTAHVFQIIPGQNRIFMGWYSQGTQVIDFYENANGTLTFHQVGWFLPANANTWVSHVFKVQPNPNGTYTYWGATGDFNFGERGRSAIDIYKVTLPAPPPPGG